MFRNVGFRNYGQLGFSESYDPRYGLAFLNTGDSTASKPSYVKGCSFDWGFSAAIGVFGANNLAVENNVGYRPVGPGKGSAPLLSIENNRDFRCRFSGSRSV
jgi:hypothetical protein